MLLDDPSPLVRRALAEVFAGCEDAPPTVVHALASDQPDVAAPILQRSPLLLDSDLVEAVATGEPERQIAIATRAELALLGVGGDRRGRLRRGLPDAAGKSRPPRSCRSRSTGSCSGSAIWLPFATCCSARDDLPAPTRQALVVKLSRDAGRFRHRARMAGRGSRAAASPARLAKRPPSRSPPIRRRARCAR